MRFRAGFVEIEQKAEGMLDTYTRLKNPNFADVARAMGLWGQTVSRADQLEDAVKGWLSQPGPALLHVHVNPMQLVMPPFMQVEPAVGMALYSVRAVLHGRGNDVWEMVKENFI
ncbi:thiamine pyrophosphate-dependent enzyme (plasmid) [Bradyrhizobium sp. CB82]|uniref:thiamine pyrophosphate-dependent enzyme n=1 Tax=Bradyrhizobium sp. CB82 TaxID=3039159 RepID=UPI0024B23184|nr:thiamine pyrophosphate-dependent enzyme [Bradyrhizobium sp. CB82]WFU45720.1 thiamine pyrophosphate-dependent enzyme [Bradyrhizobium sp. CB82]